jgi:hypothetical protein
MHVRRDSQTAVASLLAGSIARAATSAKSTRSVRASRRVLASSRCSSPSSPREHHSPSNAQVAPSAREDTNSRPGPPGPAGGPPSPAVEFSSRVSEAISRSMPARSTSSSRPKECSTLALVTRATGSQVLCTNCR